MSRRVPWLLGVVGLAVFAGTVASICRCGGGAIEYVIDPETNTVRFFLTPEGYEGPALAATWTVESGSAGAIDDLGVFVGERVGVCVVAGTLGQHAGRARIEVHEEGPPTVEVLQ